MSFLRVFLIFASSVLLSASADVQSQSRGNGSIGKPPVLKDTGPHHRKWEYTTQVERDGKLIDQTHSYVELKSGGNVWSEAENRWVEADDEIEIINNRAISRKTQHQTIFSPSVLDKEGTVDLLMPGNKRIKSRVIGIAYTQAEVGKSVFIAETRDVGGGVLGRNQVVYSDAFDGIHGDIQYTSGIAFFEQDIVLKEQLPDPQEYGLDPAKVLVEIWTEFLEAPVPNKGILKKAGNAFETDEWLDFGEDSMFFGVSQVFSVPAQEDRSPLAGIGRLAVRSSKQWQVIEGKTFLIESTLFSNMRPLSDTLPKRVAKNQLNSEKLKQFASFSSKERYQPVSLQARSSTLPQNGAKRMMARLDDSLDATTNSKDPVLVMDYILVNGATGFTFEGNTTYYVTGNVFLYGTTTIEGGTVIKYAPVNTSSAYPRIVISQGGVNCKAGPYKPFICTARDDNSVGETISGSTGSPSGYYAFQAFLFWDYGPAIDLHNGRFFYCWSAFDCQYRQQITARDCQVINGYYTFVGSYSGTLAMRNILCRNFTYGFTGGNYEKLSAENVTFSQGTQLIYNYDNTGTFALTNCLIVAVSNTAGYTGLNNQTVSSTSGIFQSAGTGNNYLAANSPYRNAGATNINSQLLSSLKTRTTYAPLVVNNCITSNTVLSPQVQRDSDVPDLGYHYDPLDYVLSNQSLTNITLTLTNGVAVALTDVSGIQLYGGAKLVSEGSPAILNQIVHYRTVQENAANSSEPYTHLITCGGSYSPTPEVRLRFTGMSHVTSHSLSAHISSPVSGSMIVKLTDCQFVSGALSLANSGLATLDIQNCLFEKVACSFRGATVSVYNNSFIGGSVSFNAAAGEGYSVLDNLFDKTSIANSTAGTWSLGSNGYITGSSRLSPNSGSDVVLSSSPAYVSGALGNYYLPTSIALINSGSRTANNAGLYHHTTQTGQTKEGTSTVDLGFHYVAVSGQSVPIDTDNDGLPDYLEDRNGNGVFDSGLGESDWTTAGSSAATALRVFTPLK